MSDSINETRVVKSKNGTITIKVKDNCTPSLEKSFANLPSYCERIKKNKPKRFKSKIADNFLRISHKGKEILSLYGFVPGSATKEIIERAFERVYEMGYDEAEKKFNDHREK